MRPKSQVRDRHRSRLLRVVHEVTLRKIVRLLADDLDRVLVRADCAVRPEAHEHAAPHVLRLEVEIRIERQRAAADVVEDPDREPVPRCVRREVVEHRAHHARREFLRTQPVASADDPRPVPALGEGGEDVQV